MKKEYIQNIISKQRKINRPFRPDRPIHAKENVSGRLNGEILYHPGSDKLQIRHSNFPKLSQKDLIFCSKNASSASSASFT